MKTFRYLTGSKFCQVTEEVVAASIEMLPSDSPLRANGAKVLALAIGETVTFESGVEWTRIEDDAPTISAIFCHRGRSRKCGFCHRMVSSGDGLLCDGPSKTKKGKKATCDAFMCRACAKHVGPDRDLCPTCRCLPDQVTLPAYPRRQA